MTQQNTSAAEQMSSTAVELASQAEQLQTAIGYFRTDDSDASVGALPVREARKVERNTKARPVRSGVREAVLAGAPHMRKAAAKAYGAGGFDLDLEDASDDLDNGFARRSA